MSRRNPKGREINGVLLLDKDTGISSNTALQKVKRLFFAKKAGHTGSLDPLASGILPICLGQATKIAGFLLADNKRYFVRAQLGQITDTLDSDGIIIQQQPFEHLNQDIIFDAAKSYQGEIEQIPPMYSALKKDGQPLYKLARQGIEVDRKPRQVTIHAIKCLDYKSGILSLEVSCSKGTYIRTLIDDIGKRLGCGAHVIELRRTGFAHLDISQAISFSALEKLVGENYQQLDEQLLPAETLLPSIHNLYLNKQQTQVIKHGGSVAVDAPIAFDIVKLFDNQHIFIGIGESDGNAGIKPKRLFV